MGCLELAFGQGEANKLAAMEFLFSDAKRGGKESQFCLGLAYMDGQGVDQSSKKAVKWWKKSSKQGYSPAQFHLGMAYLEGRGLEKDAKKVGKWFQMAAVQGHAEARLRLRTPEFESSKEAERLAAERRYIQVQPAYPMDNVALNGTGKVFFICIIGFVALILTHLAWKCLFSCLKKKFKVA